MRKSRRYLQPISTRPPNNEEKLQSKMLRQAMQECAIYETEESQKARDKAIATLRSVVRSWAKKVGSGKEADSCARVELYGSCRLGVQSPESDIDAVVIAQSRIRHGAFFGGLQAMLRECKEIRNFVALPNTFAPIMKMTIHGIDVDVSLASLPIHQLPAHWDPLDSEGDYLHSIDPKSLLALGGVRNSDLLVRMVPNVDSFRLFLRCLRHWARTRGIYSNALGYFGGISWAILAARICLLYPNGDLAMHMRAFFQNMVQYPWPKPLCVDFIEEREHLQFSVFKFGAPTPSSAPIITPAYPSMNSTHNFGLAALSILKAEISRGYAILQNLHDEGDPGRTLSIWSSLLDPRDFFAEFKHFLMVTTWARDEEREAAYTGLLQAKIRFLVNWVNSVHGVSCCLWPRTYRIPANEAEKARSNGRNSRKASRDEVVENAFFIGIRTQRGMRSLELGGHVGSFVNMVKYGGDIPRQDGTVNVAVSHVRLKYLPPSALVEARAARERRRRKKMLVQKKKKQQQQQPGSSSSTTTTTTTPSPTTGVNNPLINKKIEKVKKKCNQPPSETIKKAIATVTTTGTIPTKPRPPSSGVVGQRERGAAIGVEDPTHRSDEMHVSSSPVDSTKRSGLRNDDVKGFRTSGLSSSSKGTTGLSSTADPAATNSLSSLTSSSLSSSTSSSSSSSSSSSCRQENQGTRAGMRQRHPHQSTIISSSSSSSAMVSTPIAAVKKTKSKSMEPSSSSSNDMMAITPIVVMPDDGGGRGKKKTLRIVEGMDTGRQADDMRELRRDIFTGFAGDEAVMATDSRGKSNNNNIGNIGSNVSQLSAPLAMRGSSTLGGKSGASGRGRGGSYGRGSRSSRKRRNNMMRQYGQHHHYPYVVPEEHQGQQREEKQQGASTTAGGHGDGGQNDNGGRRFERGQASKTTPKRMRSE